MASPWFLTDELHSSPGGYRRRASITIERAERINHCAMMFPACQQGMAEGDGEMNQQEDAWTRVMRLMRDLEALLLSIKEAAVPVLTTGDADQAWRTRRFLRLADRLLEDMQGLNFASDEPAGD